MTTAPYRESRATARLKADVDALFPGRDRVSDGWIGDAAHATRASDHNPWVKDHWGVGVVTARDITEWDPPGKIKELDDWLVSRIIENRDGRVKYLIHEGRVYSGTQQDHPAWQPRPYYGINQHEHHLHVSVKSDPGHYDDGSSWNLKPPSRRDLKVSLRKLRKVWGSGREGGFSARRVQRALNKVYDAGLVVDGRPGPLTVAAWKVHQRKSGYQPNGRMSVRSLRRLAIKAGFKYRIG